jgi:hypothetical protein
MRLRKYWFKFDLSFSDPHPIGTLMGCGVTALSQEEALELLSERVFRSRAMPPIEKCIEDVEICQLDAKHVLPNICDPSQRGIWFPLGYQPCPDNVFSQTTGD